MRFSTGVAVCVLGIAFGAVSGVAVAADHPDSGSDCASCHAVGQGQADTPKVMPAPPGFFAKLLGKKPMWGHPSVSCAGTAGADGTVTGCHRPEEGHRHLLVVDTEGRPSDEFCSRCHAEQAKPGAHHPTYRTDNDGDGVPESMVRPATPQEVYTTYAPSAQPEPARSYPDALVFLRDAAGTQVRAVGLPLQTTVEAVGTEQRTEADVTTCITCHNPHYGYLAEVESEEQLNRELVARAQGDALLRLRDYDNALCEACH